MTDKEKEIAIGKFIESLGIESFVLGLDMGTQYGVLLHSTRDEAFELLHACHKSIANYERFVEDQLQALVMSQPAGEA